MNLETVPSPSGRLTFGNKASSITRIEYLKTGMTSLRSHDTLSEKPLLGISDGEDIDLEVQIDAKAIESSTFCIGFHTRAKKLSLSLLQHLTVSLLCLVVVSSLMPEHLIYLIHRTSPFQLSIPRIPYPLRSHVRWEKQDGDTQYWSNMLYMGPPSPDSDRAWNEMLHPHGFRVSDEEAAQLNLTSSLPLTSGGYSSILGVSHNLHCLRHIRQLFYKEYYYPDLPAETFNHLLKHALHCLESVRLSVMCHPDLNISPYYTTPNPAHPLNVGTWVSRECVSWEILFGAMKKRKYERTEYGDALASVLIAAEKPDGPIGA